MKRNEEKRQAFEALIDKTKFQMIFDMTHGGVVLPGVAREASLDGKHLMLTYSKENCGYLKVADQGVSCQVTFKGKHHLTVVPWEAVMGLILNNTVVENWSAQPPPEPLKDGKLRSLADAVTNTVEDKSVQADPDDFDLTNDPEMAKWFSGKIAQG